MPRLEIEQTIVFCFAVPIGILIGVREHKHNASCQKRPINAEKCAHSLASRTACTHRGLAKLFHKASNSRYPFPSLLWTYCLVEILSNGGDVEFVPRNMDSFAALSAGCFAGAECSRGSAARLRRRGSRPFG